MKEQELLLTSLIGKTLEEATNLCKQSGYSISVTMKDKISYATTMDFSFTRVNVRLVKGLVTKADIG